MEEYVSLQAVLDIVMQYCPDDDGSCSKADVDLREMLDEIEALPSADVQPVDRWISIEESKPKDMQQVLAVVDGDVREAFYNAGCFIGSNFYRSINEVKWWQPLPEPPKDGDTNE